MLDDTVIAMTKVLFGGLLVVLGLILVFAVLGQAVLIVRRSRMRRAWDTEHRD